MGNGQWSLDSKQTEDFPYIIYHFSSAIYCKGCVLDKARFEMTKDNQNDEW